MQGKIIRIDNEDGAFGSYVLTVVVEKKEIQEPLDLRKIDFTERLKPNAKHLQWLESDDYKNQLKEIEDFEKSIRLGKIEIEYT